MRKYGGDVHFVCLEARTLAQKQFSISLFYYAIRSQKLFSNNSIYPRYLVLIAWIPTVTVQSQIYGALTGFINDRALSCRRVKKTVKQFCSSNYNPTCA